MPKYSDILSSFKSQETLSPVIWNDVKTDNPVLKPHIRKALLLIAEEFVNFLDIDFFIDDITFTGSLANFNYNQYSDLDIHVMIDFKKIDNNEEIVKKSVDGYRFMWNLRHNIRIKGHDVELYIQDINLLQLPLHEFYHLKIFDCLVFD